MAVLDREGVEIYYEAHGSGPAIVLTHGFSWGHGQSGSPEADALYSEALTTADIAALLDHLGFETAVIGGLSLGGYMSLAFYADFPERTDALLIIDTGPGYKRDEGRAAWNRQANASADAIEKHGLVALAGGSAERSKSVHKDLQGLVRAGRNMLIQSTPRVIESLPGIAVPTIVVAGAEDEPFLAATDYMAAKIPGAEKLIVPNAGHAVNLDQPEVFNAAIRSFLEANGL
jgi:pimeloyl-ACP methyl ester carboxylesterase